MTGGTEYVGRCYAMDGNADCNTCWLESGSLASEQFQSNAVVNSGVAKAYLWDPTEAMTLKCPSGTPE
ncbi:hypothetical protein KKH27_13405 [bacterium]|nr:hypothetical protein [bacterium]MBU1984463.1 hypothetical protein [bacterium]